MLVRIQDNQRCSKVVDMVATKSNFPGNAVELCYVRVSASDRTVTPRSQYIVCMPEDNDHCMQQKDFATRLPSLPVPIGEQGARLRIEQWANALCLPHLNLWRPSKDAVAPATARLRQRQVRQTPGLSSSFFWLERLGKRVVLNASNASMYLKNDFLFPQS